MRIVIYALFITPLFALQSFSQEIIINGTIVDSENQRPIAFANVGIFDKNLGTVSDTEGQFRLTVPQKFASDSITISHLSYGPVKILARSFKNGNIVLEPKATVLSEVLISNKKRKTRKIGVKSYNRLLSMRVTSKSNDMVEVAQHIGIPEREVKVKAVNFALRKWSVMNGVKVRINFYEDVANVPQKNMVQQNIVVGLPTQTDTDWIRVDLDERDIYISQDFFVGIEFIPNFENPTIVDLGGILTKGKGYSRENSLGSWSKLNGAVAINVEIEY